MDLKFYKKSVSLLSLLVLVSASQLGCVNQTKYDRKVDQTDRQYLTDQSYCRSQAAGQNNDFQGNSTLHLRLKASGSVSYEDCMNAMGYQETKKIAW